MNRRNLQKHLKYIVPELRLALIKEPSVKPQTVYSPDCLEQFVEPLKHFSEEHFVSFHMNARNQVIGYHSVSHGTVSESLVHPREVFKAALLSNAYSIIVAHNHPGGSKTASSEDINISKTLIKAGDLMGVKVIDHIIVTADGLTSMREDYHYLWV